MSSSIARTTPARIRAPASAAGVSCSPAAHTSCPDPVTPMPDRGTVMRFWMVTPQQRITQLATVGAATPRSTSSRWFCNTENTVLPFEGTPFCHAAMFDVPSR